MTTVSISDSAGSAALSAWRSVLGEAQVLDGDAAARHFGADCGGAHRRLAGALRPTPEHKAVLPAVLEIARQYRLPLHPISTGRNWGYGTALPHRSDVVILDMSAFDRIVAFDATLGTVTVEPGVTQAMLADFLKRHGDAYLVPTTGAGPDCSLLANALERGYGITPHADHFGALSDLEVLLPNGEWLRGPFNALGVPRLDRLFRYGIGPYWAGLFTQSGLGLVTQASIALAPRPERTGVFLFSLRDDALLETAVARVRHVLEQAGGLVGGINLMNRHRILSMSVPYPRDALGGQRTMPDELVDRLARRNMVLPWTGFGTLYCPATAFGGIKRHVRQALRGVASRLVFMTPQRVALLQRLAGWLPAGLNARVGPSLVTLSRSLELIQGTPNATALPLAYWRGGTPPADGRNWHPSRDGCGLLWYAPLIPMEGDAVRDYVGWVGQRLREHGLEPLITLTSLSNRLFDSTVPLLFDRQSEAETRNAQACLRLLLEEGRTRGYAPYRLGVDNMDWLFSQDAQAWSFSAGLKRSIDPDGIFSPGRYTPET